MRTGGLRRSGATVLAAIRRPMRAGRAIRAIRATIRAAVLGLGLGGATAAFGATGDDPAIAAAEAAARDLRTAITGLAEAGGGRDRIAALTATIRGYEQGLGAMRDAMRRTAIREHEIAAAFAARRDRIGRLLGAMTAIGAAEGPMLMLHPDGPLGTARSGMILATVTPALQAEADAIGHDLATIRHLRALHDSAAATLRDGLVAAQEARAALSQAIQDRTDLPRRFLEDPEELTALRRDAGTLEAFADGLAVMETDIGAPAGDFAGAKGRLALPALGRVLRRAGEADAAGIRRPGLVLATEPAALVTAPWPATIRYRGPLLDYANVMILEPATGYLLVLAGLATVYGETGDVVAAGAPLGLMGGGAPDPAAATGPVQEGGGAGRTETLYIELRQGEEPLDPAGWFMDMREDGR